MHCSRALRSTINSRRVSPAHQSAPPTAQIPIAAHVARRGPPNAPKSRFRPLQVFVRRPPAFVARFEAADAAAIGKRRRAHAFQALQPACDTLFRCDRTTGVAAAIRIGDDRYFDPAQVARLCYEAPRRHGREMHNPRCGRSAHTENSGGNGMTLSGVSNMRQKHTQSRALRRR
jgi:hypothetical protein